jgi:malonate decarboxylase delta subunit
MQALSFHHTTRHRAAGDKPLAIIGVVASGNLEVLVERTLPDTECHFDIATSVTGFDAVWSEVCADFADQNATGGLTFSINDMGARPDTVALRLSQALRLIADKDQ